MTDNQPFKKCYLKCPICKNVQTINRRLSRLKKYRKGVIKMMADWEVNVLAKKINKDLTGNKFVDKSIDDYIYASLTQPPIKIIDKRGSNDELDYIVECPNCGSHICYGTDTFMYAGHIYCSKEGCREEVVSEYESKRS